jgi:ssDNA thymidine ADP-ribosyltransferase, DarT
VALGLGWVFSNGNCGALATEYFDDLGLLSTKVDWPLQRARMWNATADDPTRATRRAAGGGSAVSLLALSMMR